MTEKTEILYRAAPQYNEGIRAYKKEGSRNMTCPNSPYPSGGEKISWLVGWLDARTADILGEEISA